MLKLIHGENYYASGKALAEAKQGFAEIINIDGSEVADVNEIVIHMDNMSLFQGQNKLIIIRRLFRNKKKKLLDDFKAQLDKLSTPLVLWEDAAADKRTALYKKIKKDFEVIEHSSADENELADWVKNRGKELGIDVSKVMSAKLLSMLGYDQNIIDNELLKLSLYKKAKSDPTVTEADLNIISPIETEGDIWTFVEAISRKDKATLLEIAEKILTDANKFPFLISMLSRQLKVLILMLSGYSDSDLTDKLKIHPFTLKKAKVYLRNFSLQQLKIFFAKLANLDFSIKEGKIDAKLGITLFLASI